MSKLHELSIQSDSFDALRADFDHVLKKTLFNMREQRSPTARISLKLDIELTKDMVDDVNSAEPGKKRWIDRPRFEHKVSSVMQIKSEQTGEFDEAYELVYDESKMRYLMVPITDAQTSLFTEGEDE